MNKKIIFTTVIFFSIIIGIKNVNAASTKIYVDTEKIFDEVLLNKTKYVEDKISPYLNNYSYIISSTNYFDNKNYAIYIYYSTQEINSINFDTYMGGYYYLKFDTRANNCNITVGSNFENDINTCINALQNYSNPSYYPGFQIANSNINNKDYAWTWIYKSSNDLTVRSTNSGLDFYQNDKLLKQGDTVVTGVNSLIKDPKLQFEEISYELNDDDTYKTKTIKFSFDIYDVSKYIYKYSFNNYDYSILEKNDLTILFKTNGSIYFKVFDLDNNELEKYLYTIKDINVTKFGDSTLDISDSKFPDFDSTVDKDVTLEEDSSVGSMIQWFYNNITNKFKLIIQIKNIYDSWTSWEPRYDKNICYNIGPRLDANGHLIFSDDFCAPNITFDLKIPGTEINEKIRILDFRVIEPLRETAFDYMKLFIYLYTFYKCVKILSDSFGGSGDS